MKVELQPNRALASIFSNNDQLITLDANILIPPDRSRYGVECYSFELFKKVWLEPLFDALPVIAIHEAVYEEILTDNLKEYFDEMINAKQQKLRLHRDSELTAEEAALRNSIEERISVFTKYSPALDNKEDRGEVKTLAYIAVKNMTYFVANDLLAIQLVENAELWETNLDYIQIVKMYELIYYLYNKTNANKKGFRMIYKYLFYLTRKEKAMNPAWAEFVSKMNSYYSKW